jgi:para-nitrobenzyl esterase
MSKLIADRRSLLKSIAAAAGAAAPTLARAQAAPGLFKVVETASGKVQGMVNGPIWEFRGLPYAAPTGGKNRWMPPRTAAAWKGVRETTGFGQICPQTQAEMRSDYAQTIYWDRQGGPMGEDCLMLNVWTPSTERTAKKPVMVYFHGGGFVSGAGSGQGFDGKQLAWFGDAVVVTLNHRLGSFGYLDLAGAGAPEPYRYAGVVGLLDLVAALEWVKTNIEAFGGDPGRVMIFGQSGGGAKTSAVMAMPPAKGLFHSAAIQSGSALRAIEPDSGARAAAAFLAKLGVTKANWGALQTLSWQDILSAQTTAGANFAPVIGTDALPTHPWDPKAPEVSADVPVIISTALDDAAVGLFNYDLTEDALKAQVGQRYGARGAEILAAYRRRYPKKSPYLVQAEIQTDAGWRRAAVTQAERKAAQGRGKVWMYEWDWATPAYDGKFGAIHGLDVSASFHSYRDNWFAGMKDARLMADRLASGFAALARNGDPNNPLLPAWPTYDATTRATMMFDNDTRVENDPRPEFRRLWNEVLGTA